MKTLNILLSAVFFSAVLISTSTFASDRSDRSRFRQQDTGHSSSYSEKTQPGNRYDQHHARRGHKYPVRHYRHQSRHGHHGHNQVTVIRHSSHYSGVRGHYTGVSTIAGAIIGGAIGNNLGHGNPGATVAGAFIGATIGGNLGHHRHHRTRYYRRSY